MPVHRLGAPWYDPGSIRQAIRGVFSLDALLARRDNGVAMCVAARRLCGSNRLALAGRRDLFTSAHHAKNVVP